jgi:hypothetical protein
MFITFIIRPIFVSVYVQNRYGSKPITLKLIAVSAVVDGKITEESGIVDTAGLMRQIA